MVESINIKGPSRGNLAKHILDSSWSKFLGYLSYKADWYDRTVVVVDRTFLTSKICSRCGYIYRNLKLSERVWECPVCKAVHDRDENAATNLRNYVAVCVNSQ